MNARQRILERLRATAPRHPGAAPDIAAHYAGPLPSLDVRVGQFVSQLTAAHAEVIVSGAAGWADQAAQALVRRGVRRLLADWQEPSGQMLARALPAVERLSFDRPIEAWKAALFEGVDAGFSVADAAIAATGTLVFRSGPRAPRTVSLVPPVHLALLPVERLHADLHSAMIEDRWSGGLPTNLIMVSGPSKTADIQQTLAYGAHGPKELIVIVVVPEGAQP